MSTVEWTWKSDHAIASTTAEGQRVLDEVVQTLRLNDWIPHDVFSVQLAMEEALVNAIKHGNQHDPDKLVSVSCRMTPDLLRVEIADEGPGFNPAELPDPTDDAHIDTPNGRGVMLMRSFMSRVEFSAQGNRVTMEKDRQPPS